MEQKDQNQASSSPATSTVPAERQQPIDKPIPKDTSMSSAARNTNGDDDEEEEGMLKVDEEGQIEEDEGAVHQKGGVAPSSSASNGYVSPRHASTDRDRDRDRYHETSPGPSSSYAPQRSRFGYPAEPGSSYSATSAYSYPANHREPLRPDPYASGSRSSFSGSTPRADNRRGWYPSSSTATTPRGSDTYRPGANRDRERERDRDRDWDSFRDGERDREWATLEREREREGYRHSAYPAAAAGKYGFDNREFGGRRPASPSANLGRDRDFDADRSRDRDRPSERDPRVRAPSSGWGSGAMRQWGKPTDGGWDTRSGRRPASDDARSDTSQRQSGPRSNATPPATGSSEAGARAVGSDLASEKSDPRSRDMSPQPARSPQRDLPTDKVADVEAVPSSDAKDATQDASETVSPVQSESVDMQDDKKEEEHQAKAETIVQEASTADASVSAQAEGKEGKDSEMTQAPAAAPASTDESEATSGAFAGAVEERVADEEQAQPDETADTSTAQQADVPVAESDKDQVAKQAQAQQPSVDEVGQVEPSESMAAPQSTPQEDSIPQTAPADAQLPSTATGTEVKDSAESSPKDLEAFEDAPASKAPEAAPSDIENVPSAATAQPTATELPDELMQVEAAEPVQVTSKIAEETATQPATLGSEVVKSEEVSEAVPALKAQEDVVDEPMKSESEAPAPESGVETPAGTSVEVPALPASEPTKEAIDDVDMPDAESQQRQPQQVPAKAGVGEAEPPVAPAASADSVIEAETRPEEVIAVAESADPTEIELEGALTSVADVITDKLETETTIDSPVADTKQAAQTEDQATLTQVTAGASSATAPDVPPAPAQALDIRVDTASAEGAEHAAETSQTSASVPQFQAVEANIKVEEEQAQDVGDVSMSEAVAESASLDTAAHQESNAETRSAESAQAADAEAAPSTSTATGAQPAEADVLAPTTSQIQVSGQYVTATIDTEKKTQEIALPHVDYGDDKEAQDLVQQEVARIEEVEMPAADQVEPSLRIAEIDDTAKEIEPPLMTPSTQEQVDRAIERVVRQHIASGLAHKDDWKRIIRENQLVSQRTTMDVLKAKIHGIPQIVSSDQPLWLEEDDKKAQRTQAQLFSQLLDRKKRLNGKIEALKKRYRSINEDWKLHCARLDRSAERREMLRRPPANTPAGTPGAFGVEDPSSGGGGGGGGGLLGASLTTGRANRRSAQTGGFAGFGDAVRSEAEFLEILASLENADMQDPNMRAARTTATAPDMFIDPDSEHLMELRYDDVNGFVADPLAFYLDEFDPDVWSEEEKAIFARRYALWPKQFGKIAQALPHKTPAQCVRYYYLNKKVSGNDFKALAAARNRERKRKARVKPKKAKGSALMADLKSAKGEEVDDLEDGSGVRSPIDAVDPSGATADVPMSSNGRRGGRSRMVPPPIDGVQEDGTANRKRQADQSDLEAKGAEGKADKRKSGPKSKRAKSDGTSAADKSRKSRPGGKKDSAALEEAKAGVPASSSSALSGPKVEASEDTTSAGIADATAAAGTSAEVKARLEDSDLAAAEALGALAGLFGGPSPADARAPGAISDGAASQQGSGEVDADGRKAGKKRRSKTAAPGEEGGEVGGGKGRGKQPTSSYWSVAERYEFLRALVVHGPRWEAVSATLAQKSTAQARNYFARNEDEVDFGEAAALARSHADAPLEERERAALAFVRTRFANNSAPGVLHVPSGGPFPPTGSSAPGFGGDAAAIPSRTTHLPPPPGISASSADTMDVKMREESPEPAVHRRGLQINSLLNDTNDAASSRVPRRSSLQDWQADRGDVSQPSMGRDASVPPSLYARQARDVDQRPLTADRLETTRPLSSDGRTIRDEQDERARAYDRLDPHRPAVDRRDPREDAVESRSWMYDSPYEAHHRSAASPGYAAMAPPSHPSDRGVPASRYSMPPSSVSSSGHIGRSAPPMPSHLSSNEDMEAERERERERDRDRGGAGYGMYGSTARSREHESHSMPPSVSGELRRSGSNGEQISPTSAQFGASHGYSRYAPSGASSLYPSSATAAASSALAARGRPSNGPLTAPLPSTSERATYEQRWQRYSQSPGPSISATSAGAGAAHAPSTGVSSYSAGSAYRSSSSPYSSFPSQSLPRPSLPSLSASGGKVGAPHLPSLGAAGRSLPPILGSFPAPGRGLGGPASRTTPGATGEEAASRYWPYPHRPRGHDQPPPSN